MVLALIFKRHRLNCRMTDEKSFPNSEHIRSFIQNATVCASISNTAIYKQPSSKQTSQRLSFRGFRWKETALSSWKCHAMKTMQAETSTFELVSIKMNRSIQRHALAPRSLTPLLSPCSPITSRTSTGTRVDRILRVRRERSSSCRTECDHRISFLQPFRLDGRHFWPAGVRLTWSFPGRSRWSSCCSEDQAWGSHHEPERPRS